MTLGPLMIDVAGTALTAAERDRLGHPLVGGVILFSRNFEKREQLVHLTREIRDQRSELLIAADYEGGRVQRFRTGFTRLPPMARIGALRATDPRAALAAAQAAGWTIGSELAAAGIDLPLAPVLDLDRGRASVIGNRAFHAEPGVVIELAGAVRAGLRAAGVAATGKHYPGHGGVTADSHADLPIDDRCEAELADDAMPFEALIEQGLESIMMAHIRYAAVAERPASMSAHWIRERLRGRLGFPGAVFCDDLSMGGAQAVGDYLQRASAALAAGCDILPVCNNPEAVSELLQRLPDRVDPEASARRLALRRAAAEPMGEDRGEGLARLRAMLEPEADA